MYVKLEAPYACLYAGKEYTGQQGMDITKVNREASEEWRLYGGRRLVAGRRYS